jgi:hypothetical protein
VNRESSRNAARAEAGLPTRKRIEFGSQGEKRDKSGKQETRKKKRSSRNGAGGDVGLSIGMRNA